MKKKNLYLGSILIIVLLICAYFFYFNQSNEEKNIEWITKEYVGGYTTISYPSDWKLVESLDNVSKKDFSETILSSSENDDAVIKIITSFKEHSCSSIATAKRCWSGYTVGNDPQRITIYTESDNVEVERLFDSVVHHNSHDTYIESIYPTSGPVGTVVEIRGSNITNTEFDGVPVVQLKDKAGKVYFVLEKIESGKDSSSNWLRITVKDKLCSSLENFNCKEYSKVVPGVYEINTGVGSNGVKFEVTKS